MNNADLRNLAALAEMARRWGSAKNGKIEDVPGWGAVVVNYKAIHRLGDLGLVTWRVESKEIETDRGHLFGRTGGTRRHVETTVFAELTDAGRAALNPGPYYLIVGGDPLRQDIGKGHRTPYDAARAAASFGKPGELIEVSEGDLDAPITFRILPSGKIAKVIR